MGDGQQPATAAAIALQRMRMGWMMCCVGRKFENLVHLDFGKKKKLKYKFWNDVIWNA
jgi:hypothetical protein